MTEFYRLHIRGHLDDHWSDRLEDLVIQRLADGTTELVGPIVDQAALHGMIARIRDLGLPLLSIVRIDPNQITVPGIK